MMADQLNEQYPSFFPTSKEYFDMNKVTGNSEKLNVV
jgi:hypothetical protein